MLRLDMSEYMERHSVAKLIGAPPGQTLDVPIQLYTVSMHASWQCMASHAASNRDMDSASFVACHLCNLVASDKPLDRSLNAQPYVVS